MVAAEEAEKLEEWFRGTGKSRRGLLSLIDWWTADLRPLYHQRLASTILRALLCLGPGGNPLEVEATLLLWCGEEVEVEAARQIARFVGGATPFYLRHGILLVGMYDMNDNMLYTSGAAINRMSPFRRGLILLSQFLSSQG